MRARVVESLYTPAELIEKYPQVQKFGWTAVKIGMFYHSGLLFGRYSHLEKKSLIQENSFIRLMTFFNEINSSLGKKIPL